MLEAKRLKFMWPVAGVCLAGMLLICGLIGCSASEEKPVAASDESFSAVADHGEASSSSAAREPETSFSSSSEREGAAELSSSSTVLSAADTAAAHEVSGFVALSQYPELPNGCEVTSLASVLNYCGFDIDKGTLSDVYLPKAPVGQADFYQEFVGDPRDSDAYGCYSPVIVTTANSYLSSVGSSMRARDLTGSSPDDLYALIDKGKPVIVWATQYMNPSHYSVTWNVNGNDLTWRTPEHCLVLVGYDDNAGTVQLADPMEGAIVSYDKDLFESRYYELNNQAVVIE